MFKPNSLCTNHVSITLKKNACVLIFIYILSDFTLFDIHRRQRGTVGENPFISMHYNNKLEISSECCASEYKAQLQSCATAFHSTTKRTRLHAIVAEFGGPTQENLKTKHERNHFLIVTKMGELIER